MAEPSQEASSINNFRLFGVGPQEVRRAVERTVNPLLGPMELLRRFYTNGNQPAPAQAPAAPTENPAPPGQGPRQTSVVTAGAAGARSIPEATPVMAAEPSLLERLRQSVARDLTPAESTSSNLATFGRGVLSGRGSFLDNLSAGLAAQEEAAKARRTETRQSLETQARIAEIERKAKLDEAKLAAEAPLREAQAYYYRNFAGRRGGDSSAATERMLVADERTALGRALQAVKNDPRYISLTAEQQIAKARELMPEFLTQILNERRVAATPGAPPAAAPAAPSVPVIGPQGRPAQ